MKITALTLAAVLVAGAAAPAFADSLSDFDRDFLVAQLRDRGVAAVEVYENGDNRIRAVVQTADGSEQFQYFYEDTLQPVGANYGHGTRVLSKVDVGGRSANGTSPTSLLVDTFDD